MLLRRSARQPTQQLRNGPHFAVRRPRQCSHDEPDSESTKVVAIQFGNRDWSVYLDWPFVSFGFTDRGSFGQLQQGGPTFRMNDGQASDVDLVDYH